MATNWLSAMFVDVRDLERNDHAEVRQRVRWDSSGQTKALLPVFDVRWGHWEKPVVDVSISGVNKQIIHLRIEDTSFSKRPTELIKNRDELLAIPDGEFQKLSSAQRDDIVAKFALIQYAGAPGEATVQGLSAARPDTNAPIHSDKGGPTLGIGSALRISFEDPVGVERSVCFAPVQEDGSLMLLSNRVFASRGKTCRELEKEIKDYYVPGSFKNVRIMITDAGQYTVEGEVRSPGLRVLFRPTTLLQAIDIAGGFTDSANKKKVQLIRYNHERIVVNCVRAKADPKLDVSVYHGDRIVVPKR
jgi:hypothetical protein